VDLGFHLASCRRCREHTAQLQATVDLLRSLPDTTGAVGATSAAPSVKRFEAFHHFGRGARES
jgi:anti-sigma factor RsiW